MPELAFSNLRVSTTNLDDVLLFEPKVFRDFRGANLELYNERDYSEAINQLIGQKIGFVQDSMSCSYKDVLRGLHGDAETWKLISCLEGRILLAVVDCREKESFGKSQVFFISEEDRRQVLVPPMYANGHLVLSPRAIFHYKQSTYYDPKRLVQFSYRFDDPRFDIWWPVNNPMLSERDEKADTTKTQTL
jgi:dTDP-4-dehydrorhamnose 3,5-epimerase